MKDSKGSFEYDNALFVFSISYTSVIALIGQIFIMLFGNDYHAGTIIGYTTLGVLLIYSIPSLKQSINLLDLLFVSGFVVLQCMSLTSHISSLSFALSEIRNILKTCIICYLGAKVVHPSKQLCTFLRCASFVVFIRVIFEMYLSGENRLLTTYSQYYGYNLLTAMGLIFVPVLRDKKITDWILACIIAVYTLLSGARGPFVITILMLISCIALSGLGNNRKYISILCIAVLAFLVNKYIDEILRFITEAFGVNTSHRNVRLLLEGEIFNDKNRNRLYSFVIGLIEEKWQYGVGLLNDRILISNRFGGALTGSYPHNFFLEVFLQFGMLGGGLLIVLFFLLIYQRYTRSLWKEEKYILISLVFIGFLPLMVSESYVKAPMFYALIGFCTNRWLAASGEDTSKQNKRNIERYKYVR